MKKINIALQNYQLRCFQKLKVYSYETSTKCNLFLDKSIVDDEDRKLELFELFLSSVSEEIVNKYYENIEEKSKSLCS